MHRLLPATKLSLSGLYVLFSHVLYCMFDSDSNCVWSGENENWNEKRQCETETKMEMKLKLKLHSKNKTETEMKMKGET